MPERLRDHLKHRVSVSDRDYETIRTFFTPKRLRKRQFLLQEGEVCRQLAFVLDGCLRSYTVDAKGEEHILQFAIADWWISDLESFLSETPSHQTIDAVHDSEVLLLDAHAREAMMAAVPKMERFFRLLLEANYIATRRRIAETLSVSAEERYLSFLRTYPSLVEQVPLGQIASYLGITPQSLSRIRKELASKKR